MNEATPIVYVVDDDSDVRHVLAWLMGSVDLEVRSFANAREFLDERVGGDRPECLILDVRMPGMSGLELQERFIAEDDSLSVVFLTGHGDIPMATHAMVHGAFAFLEKPYQNQKLIDTVHQAIERSRYKLGNAHHRQTIGAMYARLTERERDVFAAVVDGRTSKEIAYDLGLSNRTIEVHRKSIMEKMAVRNVAELVRLAMEGGLVGGNQGEAKR